MLAINVNTKLLFQVLLSHISNLNMRVLNMHVTNNLQQRVFWKLIFFLNMKDSSMLVISVTIKLHDRAIWKNIFTGNINWVEGRNDFRDTLWCRKKSIVCKLSVMFIHLQQVQDWHNNKNVWLLYYLAWDQMNKSESDDRKRKINYWQS